MRQEKLKKGLDSVLGELCNWIISNANWEKYGPNVSRIQLGPDTVEALTPFRDSLQDLKV